MGTYNAEITSLSFMNVLTTLNNSAATVTTGTTGGAGSTGSAGGASGGIGGGASSGGGATGSTGIGSTGSNGGATGSTGSTGSTGTAGGKTGATISNAGFGNTTLSLSGAIPGAGRFYFDGAGNIWGRQTGTSASAAQTMIVGSYSVSNNCTASMTLNSGEHFNAVIADQGGEVLFMQSDAGSGGSIGTLTRAVEACNGPVAFPQNFAFNLFGAQQNTSATSSTGAAGSTGAAATTTTSFAPYAAVGEVNLADNGSFTLTEWIYQNGSTQSATATGTYSVSQDCSLQLTFASPATGGSTGSVSFQAPLSFRATLNRPNATGRNATPSSGILSVEPRNVTTVVGTFLAQ